MTIDITRCSKVNIIDSCSIWNLISSLLLYSRINANGFYFSITQFVEYECLFKERSNPSNQDNEIQKRLRNYKNSGAFPTHQLSIADLQDSDIIKHSQHLGRGELSSIAFCKKTGQVFLTDDQKARKIAKTILGEEKTQTVPHLVGWLFYAGILSYSDIDPIIEEHKFYDRPLEKYFRLVYDEAMRIRLLSKCS
jgi:predicted nucleic acid-binding protein